MIDWEYFRKPIEQALHVDPKAPGGRPPFDRIMMFKIIILQHYYNLSDEQTEFQIKDRLSFQQFLGLQIGERVPDDEVPLEGRRRYGILKSNSKNMVSLKNFMHCLVHS